MVVSVEVENVRNVNSVPLNSIVDSVSLVRLFGLKYGAQPIESSFKLAQVLGLEIHACVDLELALERHLLAQLNKLGFAEVSEMSLEKLCPQCLRAYKLNAHGLPVPILFEDKEQGEIVCSGCGFVVACSGDSDLIETDDSLPMDQTFQPSSDASVNGGKGGTLRGYNQGSEGKGMEQFLNENSRLVRVDFNSVCRELPGVVADLLRVPVAWVEKANLLVDRGFVSSQSDVLFLAGSELASVVPYVFNGNFAFQLRVYKKGPKQGLIVVDKLPLRDFEASAKSAFDCAKVRVQKLQAMLGVEEVGLDGLKKLGTQLCGEFGIGSKPLDKVFVNSNGQNIIRAFDLKQNYDFKVSNQVLVNTMFLLTLEQFGREVSLLEAKRRLKVHKGLRLAVLKISSIMLDLQNLID